MQFLADIDNFNSQFRNQKILSETLFEIEAAAKAYPKEARQILRVQSNAKRWKHRKDNGLLAVPFDERVGFCNMRKTRMKTN